MSKHTSTSPCIWVTLDLVGSMFQSCTNGRIDHLRMVDSVASAEAWTVEIDKAPRLPALPGTWKCLSPMMSMLRLKLSESGGRAGWTHFAKRYDTSRQCSSEVILPSVVLEAFNPEELQYFCCRKDLDWVFRDSRCRAINILCVLLVQFTLHY